ncbi:unnamed protein product [Paramecium pentaurelia]|uniref:Uncharacterized protein n=1 Tax=Paramecium pentaurelia TaxID=43138 RepID=A0A8S1YI68_9CILI|nr:unnamed protein product [Paramecium pentaurelia]
MIESLMLLIQLKIRQRTHQQAKDQVLLAGNSSNYYRNCSTIYSQLSAMNQAYL